MSLLAPAGGAPEYGSIRTRAGPYSLAFASGITSFPDDKPGDATLWRFRSGYRAPFWQVITRNTAAVKCL